MTSAFEVCNAKAYANNGVDIEMPYDAPIRPMETLHRVWSALRRPKKSEPILNISARALANADSFEDSECGNFRSTWLKHKAEQQLPDVAEIV